MRRQPAKSAFRAECGEEGTAASGLDAATLYQAAYFINGRVAALSGYRPWSDQAGGPCVLTHPEYRGRGCGTAVVSMTVELALAAGKLLLYQTLESNTAAVKLAQRLGYERYAQHVAVPLKANAPSNPPLQPAEVHIERNTMTRGLGIALPDVSPLVHYAKRLDVIAWPAQRVAGEEGNG